MPVSISVSNLSWSTPDRTPLFSGLTLSFGPERCGMVGRNGTGKSTLLRLIAGSLQPSAGQVRTSGTVALLAQEALSRPDDTIADLFMVRAALDLLDRAGAGRASAEELAGADWSLQARLAGALERCGLVAGPQTPLTALSGGQRMRAALAALVFAAPDFLLLDEPTNNLDRAGRALVHDLVRGWRGGVIVVSHDRALLEEMDAIIELSPLGATRYGGPYSAYQAQREIERAAAAHDLNHAEKSLAETARRAQDASERKARKDGSGHRARAKGGQPKVLMDFAKARAEASGGAGSRLRDARRKAAEEERAAARDRVEVLQPLRMDLPSTGLQPGKTVLRLDRISGGHDRRNPVIRDLSLTITGPERILLAGPNASGKTTLIRLITGQITPLRGAVAVSVPWALLDQHAGLIDSQRSLRDSFLRLNPGADTNLAHATLARFGFQASDASRCGGALSGGERLRAGLACTLGASPVPGLLILDEPTNHLDLDAIAALESALATYDGAVLAVSHDDAFVASLAAHRTICMPGPGIAQP